ncbi:hypothetical protein [Tenacibaculum sp. 190524A02b]|uniref:tetratricopeptide repeat protein n=1 Tax=Tenacibaculum vairaonense TaxID=3137860 RepID=UPI0031FA5E46
MNIEDDILVERFLKKELSVDEEKKFIERLKVDAGFKEFFLLEKQMYESLNQEDWSMVSKVNDVTLSKHKSLFENMGQTKKAIKESEVLYKSKQSIVFKLFKFIPKVAALVLVVFAVKFFFVGTVINVEETYNNYLHFDELPKGVERGVEEEKSNLDGGLYFKERKFEKALNSFDELIGKGKSTSTTYLYKAIAHIELAQYKKAEETLNTLIKSDFIDSEKGYWYKALLYVKMNELEKSKSLLKLIIEKSYYKNKEAKKLLEELN